MHTFAKKGNQKNISFPIKKSLNLFTLNLLYFLHLKNNGRKLLRIK